MGGGGQKTPNNLMEAADRRFLEESLLKFLLPFQSAEEESQSGNVNNVHMDVKTGRTALSHRCSITR